MIDKFLNYKFLNIQNERWFKFCVIRVNHKSKCITKYNALDDYKSIADYPNCLGKTSFDFVDILIIMNIAYIENEFGVEKAIIFLYKTLTDKEFFYASSDTRHIFPSIYAGIAKIFASQNRTEECEKICFEGIKYSLGINDIHVLPHLYYLRSLSLYKIGNINKAIDRKSVV